MKVVGLVSGGKDSCYNLMQCVKNGHEIVALANLYPITEGEIDSYMYQTVGHEALHFYSEALGLPLFRRTIGGMALKKDLHYSPVDNDEVEDLYLLLKEIREKIEFDGVSVGAIQSQYQSNRVENVCQRMGLEMLAYLWQCDQKILLADMIESGVEAIIIKVASLGLMPDKHLGCSIKEIYPHMCSMSEKFGLNVCGEGGEYETFTLNCPLFVKKIVLDSSEIIIHSDDAFAPVGYLKLTELHLEDKDITA